jgi:hypothetical protein
LVEFYEIQWVCYAIESDLDAIIFNPVASTIPKWQTFKLLRWIQNFHQSVWDCVILYDDRSTFNEPLFPKKQKYKHGGWLKFKIHILFYGGRS